MFFPLLVFADPVEVFRRVQSTQPCLAPAGYCTVGLFVITWLGGCWENISDGLQVWSLLGPAVFSPLVVGIAGLGSTSVVYLVQQIGGDRSPAGPKYKSFLSLNMHCALILILGEGANFLLVHAGLMEGHYLPLANRAPLGLDLLLLGAKEPNIYLNIILHSTNIFIVWYLVVLARGIRFLTGSGAVWATVVVAALWFVFVAMTLGFVHAAGGGTTIHIAL